MHKSREKQEAGKKSGRPAKPRDVALGYALRRARERNGLSLDFLGLQLGKSKKYLSLVERTGIEAETFRPGYENALGLLPGSLQTNELEEAGRILDHAWGTAVAADDLPDRLAGPPSRRLTRADSKLGASTLSELCVLPNREMICEQVVQMLLATRGAQSPRSVYMTLQPWQFDSLADRWKSIISGTLNSSCVELTWMIKTQTAVNRQVSLIRDMLPLLNYDLFKPKTLGVLGATIDILLVGGVGALQILWVNEYPSDGLYFPAKSAQYESLLGYCQSLERKSDDLLQRLSLESFIAAIREAESVPGDEVLSMPDISGRYVPEQVQESRWNRVIGVAGLHSIPLKRELESQGAAFNAEFRLLRSLFELKLHHAKFRHLLNAKHITDWATRGYSARDDVLISVARGSIELHVEKSARVDLDKKIVAAAKFTPTEVAATISSLLVLLKRYPGRMKFRTTSVATRNQYFEVVGNKVALVESNLSGEMKAIRIKGSEPLLDALREYFFREWHQSRELNAESWWQGLLAKVPRS